MGVLNVLFVEFSQRDDVFQGGRLIAGQVDEPFKGNLHIMLRGEHSTPDWPLPEGPNQGSKVLGENTQKN